MSCDKLTEIYKRIPEMKCKHGCHECCGVVPFAKIELEAIGETAVPIEIPCYFLGENGCTIYDKRPYMCRIFGASEADGIRCPHGCRPERPLTEGETSDLTKQYSQLEITIDPIELLMKVIEKYGVIKKIRVISDNK